MREIKFRGWHKNKNKMFSPEEMGRDQLTIMPDGKGFINVHGDYTELSELIPEMIPMQFTGLLDKNGVEIYERDILKNPELPAWFPWEIQIIDGHAQLINIGVDGFRHSPIFLTKDAAAHREIIGNIYTNPLPAEG